MYNYVGQDGPVTIFSLSRSLKASFILFIGLHHLLSSATIHLSESAEDRNFDVLWTAFCACWVRDSKMSFPENVQKIELFTVSLLFALKLFKPMCFILRIALCAFAPPRVHDSKMSHFQFMVIAPSDTPYACGCFLFDGLFPMSYPDVRFLHHVETQKNNNNLSIALASVGIYALSCACLEVVKVEQFENFENFDFEPHR